MSQKCIASKPLFFAVKVYNGYRVIGKNGKSHFVPAEKFRNTVARLSKRFFVRGNDVKYFYPVTITIPVQH